LLATLFDLLQMGSFEGYFFAGSFTQIGFERRCHDARAQSGNTEPGTFKTEVTSEDHFLHIALKRDPKGPEQPHLLLSDISGERFQRARDSSTEMGDLSLLKTTGDVIFLIDGDKLAALSTRNSTLNSASGFIKRAIDMQIFTSETRLKIIVSKWDALIALGDFNYQEKVVDFFTSKFGSSAPNLSFLRIAVRPKMHHDRFHLGYGIKELLDEWLQPVEPALSIQIPTFDSSQNERYFNNLK
jgi:hypothetical protein